MVGGRTASAWIVGTMGVLALVVGASAQGGRSASQGVVTPDDPIFATQDPAPTPAPESPETPEAPEPGDGPQMPPPAAQGPGAGGGGGFGGRGGRGGGGPRTYAQLIEAARTDDGMFKVHRVGDQIYFEIPAARLDKDLLWVTSLKQTTLGAGYGGASVANRVVRWDRRGDRVFLRVVDYDVVADPDQPIARAVADANVPAIVRGFNVALTSPDDNPVIDVTALLLGEIAEFSPRASLGARGMDQSRSYLEKVVSFPENINVQVTQTWTSGGAAPGRGRAGMRGASGTVSLFHSIVALPETPMQPRLLDSRVGYFSVSAWDYGRDEPRAVQREYITRYRLEKQDPRAAVSDPVKPIVYYIDPATPTHLIPYIKQGIEDWQPAFEAAGFRNAIVARDAPTPDEDPDWDPEDVRHSVVRWLPSTVENAEGPSVTDPRSGEILEADVLMHHNILNLLTMWYVTQVGAIDPRVQTLPLPDALVGELLRSVVAHEIGHTLGFRHNMRASSLYSIEQIRDPRWVRENGHTPSIMDYARFNYVAQPEDGIPAADLVPRVGPYDRWAARWGYAPIPAATSPDAERPTLDRWAREQETTPYLRFMTSGESESAAFPFDPGQQREAIGDSDPVRATELGLRNLERVAGRLVGIASRPTEPWDDLRELYGRVVAQWRLELGHVATVVGGTDSRELYVGQPGVRFTPVARERQQAAVAFLLERGFDTPTFLVQPDLLQRIEPTGVVGRIGTAQASLMNALLQPARLTRMVEQAALDPGAYGLLDLLGDLRSGVWRELETPARPIDVYRRNVQRAFLDTVDARLNGGAPPAAEVRALLRGELRVLDEQVARAVPFVTDVATRRHLEDVRETIAMTLDPRAMRTRETGPGAGRGGGAGVDVALSGRLATTGYDFEADPFLVPPFGCWPDLRID